MEDLLPDEAAKAGSRKYKLALIALALLTSGWLISSQLPELAIVFSEFRTGLLGILGIYYTGNVANKHVVGKHMVGMKAKGDNSDGLD